MNWLYVSKTCVFLTALFLSAFPRVKFRTLKFADYLYVKRPFPQACMPKLNVYSVCLHLSIVSGTGNASAKKSFVFLTKELPVRLANIMKEIRLLPENLLSTPSVKQVEGWSVYSYLSDCAEIGL